LQALSGKKDGVALPFFGHLHLPEGSSLGSLSGIVSQQTVLLILVIVLSVVGLLSEFVSRRLTIRLAMRFTRQLRKLAVSHALKLDTGYFSQGKMGELNVRFFTPVGAVTTILMSFQQTTNSLLQIIGFVAVVIYLQPVLTTSLGLTAILLVVYVRKFHSILSQATSKLRNADITAGGVSNDLLYGMRLIKQCGEEIRQRNRFLRAFHASDSQRVRVLDVQATGNLIMQLGGMVVILAVAALVSSLNNVNLIGDMGFALGYFMALWRLLNEIYMLNALLNELSPQVPHLIGLARMLQSDDHLERLVFGPGSRRTAPANFSVSVTGLDFAYDSAAPVLRDVTLDFPEGTITALVGLSGSGKTTLLELLARIRAPQSGRIFLGGVDMADFDLGYLRRLIGYVNQEAILFNETVLYNLLLGRPQVSQEEVNEAVRMADAEDFIKRLPQGYQHLLGERGQHVSGGQRQRIALARVFLQKPRLLLLDEATSALDVRTERKVIGELFRTRHERTTVIATHRLVTIPDCDQIVFVHDGAVMEKGTHDELMARKGMYHDLFRFQSEAINAGLSPDLE
ncbi:MAG: ABC transporter ATP-binding protein, partial [Alphaproteobacteria bacterium]|nr:ABC transporter ATP-binding protein [Alphaproteobacteria bacterium]